MELTIDGEPDTSTATEEKVVEAVETMDDFVSLAISPDHYLQVAELDGALVLEYRDGGPDRHYRTTRTDLTRHDAAAIFRMYFNGDPRWREAVPWAQITSSELEGPPFWTLKSTVTVVLLVLLGLYFVLVR